MRAQWSQTTASEACRGEAGDKQVRRSAAANVAAVAARHDRGALGNDSNTHAVRFTCKQTRICAALGVQQRALGWEIMSRWSHRSLKAAWRGQAAAGVARLRRGEVVTPHGKQHGIVRIGLVGFGEKQRGWHVLVVICERP